MRTAFNVFTVFLLATAATASAHITGSDFSTAEHLFRLDNYAKARPYWLRAEHECNARRDMFCATWARVSRLRGDSETVLSYPAVSQEMAQLLATPLVESHADLRLRCLIVKGAADLSSKDVLPLPLLPRSHPHSPILRGNILNEEWFLLTCTTAC